MPSIIGSPREHHGYKKLTVQDGSGNSVEVTCNSTAMIIDDGVRLSDGTNTLYLAANSTGLVSGSGITLTSGSNTIELSANSTAMVSSAGVRLTSGSDTVDLTANSTGVAVNGGIKLNSGLHFSANSTGFIPETVSSVPSTDTDALFSVYANSTGNYMLINQTGTTWYYLNVTTVAPTVGG
mgnify:CR=1 FL=1